MRWRTWPTSWTGASPPHHAGTEGAGRALHRPPGSFLRRSAVDADLGEATHRVVLQRVGLLLRVHDQAEVEPVLPHRDPFVADPGPLQGVGAQVALELGATLDDPQPVRLRVELGVVIGIGALARLVPVVADPGDDAL